MSQCSHDGVVGVGGMVGSLLAKCIKCTSKTVSGGVLNIHEHFQFRKNIRNGNDLYKLPVIYASFLLDFHHLY